MGHPSLAPCLWGVRREGRAELAAAHPVTPQGGCSQRCCCAVPAFSTRVTASRDGDRTALQPRSGCRTKVLLLLYARERKCLAGQVDGTPNKAVCG